MWSTFDFWCENMKNKFSNIFGNSHHLGDYIEWTRKCCIGKFIFLLTFEKKKLFNIIKNIV